MIEAVVRYPLRAHLDARGSFMEFYADDWGLAINPRQWSLVRSTPGTLRGMHLHLRHDECVIVIAGRGFVGLHDLRETSATLGRSMLIELSEQQPQALVFPAGIVHGWYFPEGGMHLQAVSEPYSEYAADDNLGCHHADPALGIEWPGVPTELSERARGFPSLAALREQLRRLAVVDSSPA